MDEDSFCDNLIIWLNTFDNIQAPKSTAAELSDGVAMCQCLVAIAPDWFDDEWMAEVRRDAEENWTFKALNTRIVKFTWLNVTRLARNHDKAELGRLLQLILGCAVECNKREEYIRKIMEMEESAQFVIMHAIKELMACKDVSSPVDNDTFKDLEVQLSLLREHNSRLEAENHVLRRKLNTRSEDNKQYGYYRECYKRLHLQLQLLNEENYSLESSRDEFRTKCIKYEKENFNLREGIEKIQSLAEEQLRDVMDELRLTHEKVVGYESTVDSYKKKLEEMTKQMKMNEENNTSYRKENMELHALLDQDLRKENVMKSQLKNYMKQVHQLQSSVSENEERADRADFECKQVKDKLVELQGENERLKEERNALREENEEQTLREVSRITADLPLEARELKRSCPEMTTESFNNVFLEACSRHARREFLRTKETGKFRRRHLDELAWSGVLRRMRDYNLKMVCSCNGYKQRGAAAAISHIFQRHTKGDELYNLNDITFWKK